MRYVFDWDAGRRKVILASENLEEVRLHFSEEDEGAKIRAHKTKRYFGVRKYAITASGRFGIGLLPRILRFIKQCDENCSITITKPLKEQFMCGWDFHDQDLVKLNRSYRDYQEEIIRKGIKFGRGASVVATAGGKTTIMCGLIWSILNKEKDKKAIVILPPHLVSQTYSDFLEYGVNPREVTRWDGKNQPNPSAKVVVASTSILLSKKQDTEWVKDVDIVIGDECHKAKNGNSITKFIEKIKTPHKYGFTGTLPEKKVDEWKVLGLFGPILQEETSYDLRKKGYIANVEIQILKIAYDTVPEASYDPEDEEYEKKASEDYFAEIDFIINNTKRNNVISKICGKVDKNTLILVNRVEHGKKLEEYLNATLQNKQIYFIYGDMPEEERDRIKALMEIDNNIVVIAMAQIFSTGISINNLHYIIFGAGGKAKTQIVQSIGRGLRLHPRKTMLILFDLTDMLKYGERHLEKRLLLYDKEKIKYHVRNI